MHGMNVKDDGETVDYGSGFMQMLNCGGGQHQIMWFTLIEDEHIYVLENPYIWVDSNEWVYLGCDPIYGGICDMDGNAVELRMTIYDPDNNDILVGE